MNATTGANAAIYCRVSTGAQETDGTSLDSQEEQCRRYAAEHGYTVDAEHVHREVYTGAELWDRPRLTVLRAAVRARAVAAVIVYATDRLARDPIHLAIVAEECERHGVTLAFVTEPLDASPEGALIRYVKGYAAKIEHEKIRERTLRGKRLLAERGQLHNSGIDLYGYRRNRETRTRAIHEAEAETIRTIFRWIGEERVSIRQVVVRLNHAGTPPPSVGKVPVRDPDRRPRWGTGTLSRLLRNPAYKGEAYCWRYHDEPTRKVMRPREEWLRLDDSTTPAIVAPALWQAVQDRLDANIGADTRNQKRQYLLRGLVRCAVCGRSLHAMPEGRGRVYRCSSRVNGGTPCGGGRVPADALEGWVWGEIAAILKDPSIIAAEQRRQREQGPDPALIADLDTAKRTLATLVGQRERLGRKLREADDALWDLIEREIGAIEREKQQVQATIGEIEGRLARQQAAGEALDALMDSCARVAANVDAMTFAERRMALEALAIRIDANGGLKVRDWHGYGELPLTQEGIVFHASTSPVSHARRRPRPPPAGRRARPSRS